MDKYSAGVRIEVAVAISSPNDSPYLVLWYLYLLFLAAVFVANIIAISIRKFVDWRTARLVARYSKKGKAAKA